MTYHELVQLGLTAQERVILAQISEPRFRLGNCSVTRAALNAIENNGASVNDFLVRHEAGDWGDLKSADDIAQNEFAVTHPERILSKYVLADARAIYVITEYDRSQTSIMLTDEY